MTLPPTPGQTVGPFFGYALPFVGGSDVAPSGRPGAIRLHGRVVDGAGAPVPDALLEIRQADAQGNVPQLAGSLHRDGWSFTGWGRAATDADGFYTFSTLRPGAVAGEAPFFAMMLFARGLLHRLRTRAYLPDDQLVLARDPLLRSLSGSRRATLLATADGTGYRFDIVMQGIGETVFLE